MRAYTSSTTEGVAGAFGFVVDPTAVISSGDFIKSKAVISAASDTSAEPEDALILDSAGVVTSNAFEAMKYFQLPVFANTTARDAAVPTPAPGMMVFITGTGMQIRGATGWNTIAGTAT
jgi:hypothetical protein